MAIKDVIIFKNARLSQVNRETVKSFPPIRNKLVLEENTSIEKLPRDLSESIFSCCEPKGLSNAVRQYAQLYSFVRYNAPASPSLHWDSDERLQICMALSRLIYPTTISFEYSARIIYEEDKIHDIIPGPVSGFGAHAYVSRENSRNWLTETEGEETAALLSAYSEASLPERIKQALWYLEYAFRTQDMDVRWPLICMGLESLIHTDKYRSTKQFSFRVEKLALEVGKSDFPEQKANEAYTMRSKLAHGQLIRNIEDYKLEPYEALEDILRCVLRKAILDSSFAEIYSSDEKIRNKWPIE
jgi:hypothetical protein